MRLTNGTQRTLDVSSFVGVAVGIGLLIPSFMVAELAFLAAPASALLVLGLMFESR
jgi:hypothetical protein